MSMKIVAVRVALKRGEAEITTIGSSPRGTKVRLRSVMVPGVRGDRKAFEAGVEKAINELLPGRP